MVMATAGTHQSGQTERVSRYVTVPTVLARKARRQAEAHRLRAARQQSMNPHRSHHATYDKYNRETRPKMRDTDQLARQFIMWDGESPQDTGYSLFGNSAGYKLCQPNLSSRDCFDLILESETAHPDAINVGYGFNLDASFMFKDLSRRCITALHVYGRTVWRDYELEHIPHKWLRVKRGQVDCTIYDIHSFFQGGYVQALQTFGIGTPEQLAQLAQEKARRSEFKWADIQDIYKYWLL